MHPLECLISLIFHVRPRKNDEHLLSVSAAARLDVYRQILVFEPLGRLLRALLLAESPDPNKDLGRRTSLPRLRGVVSPLDARKNFRSSWFGAGLRHVMGMRSLGRLVRRWIRLQRSHRTRGRVLRRIESLGWWIGRRGDSGRPNLGRSLRRSHRLQHT